MNLQYSYSPNQNNGQITQFRDTVSGEQVSYAYDSLNRLISATAANGNVIQEMNGIRLVYDAFNRVRKVTFLAECTFKTDQGKLTGGTARAQAFILLHELAHALSASNFQPDFNNREAGHNDKLVEENCDKTLKRFGSR